MPCKAFGRAHTALLVTRGTIGTVHLVALHGGGVGRGANRLDDAAQGIGKEHVGAAAGGLANQHASQVVVIGVTLMHPAATVEVFLQPKGVDGHAGDATAGRAPQHATASRVVDVLFLAI